MIDLPAPRRYNPRETMKSSNVAPPVILASASPRRRELFALLGVPFSVRTAEVDETPRPGETPAHTVARLALSKASAVAEPHDSLVVAADTLVVLNGEVLGKPADAGEAIAMLRRLRGRAHQVLTGFVVLDTASNTTHMEVVTTRVKMRTYSPAEIAAYIASGDPLDKAGAYAIQHPDFAPVAKLDGCPANVMGLPVCRLAQALRACGLSLGAMPVQACRPADSVCAIHALVAPASQPHSASKPTPTTPSQ